MANNQGISSKMCALECNRYETGLFPLNLGCPHLDWLFCWDGDWGWLLASIDNDDVCCYDYVWLHTNSWCVMCICCRAEMNNNPLSTVDQDDTSPQPIPVRNSTNYHCINGSPYIYCDCSDN